MILYHNSKRPIKNITIFINWVHELDYNEENDTYNNIWSKRVTKIDGLN